MDTNPYQPPVADVDNGSSAKPSYYVVSPTKFAVLFFATLGLYAYYWFYKNWKAYRNYSGTSVWPVPRAIFYVFFTHSLFNKLDSALNERGLSYDWAPRSIATLFVLLAIVSNVLDRLSIKEIGSPTSDVLSILILLALYSTLRIPQRVINRLEGDPEGLSNKSFSAANIAWILVGAILWLLTLLGFAVMFGLVTLPE